jgi:glycosyltransferase involved in cell wall biosynthesis
LEKISVLHIITTLALGGAQKNAIYTITHLDSKKYKKHFISAPCGQLYEKVRNSQDVSFCFLDCLKRQISPINDIFAFFALVKYIKKNKISIVHTHSSKAGILGRWAARFSKVPVIIHTIHGWSFNDYLPWPVKKFYIFLERCTANITDHLIAVSENDIKKGLDNKIGDIKKYKLIHYGIIVSDFEKAAKHQPDKNEPTVAMIACFKPQKNPLDFIKAAKIIIEQDPRVKFLCIGDGQLRPKIQNAIKDLGIGANVELLGWRHDIAKLLVNIDIVVLSSLWEGLPIALLEAMAAARPIVAYDTDGVKEAVEDNITGYIVKKEDFKALANYIKSLLDDKALAREMGQAAYKKISASQFDASNMIKKIEKLYDLETFN